MRAGVLPLLFTLAAAPALAQQPVERPQPRTLHVTGTGTVQREPERAVLTVAVESRASTAQAAAQENARKMEAVYAALRRLGIVPPKVRTISYQVHPEYRQDRGTEGVPRVIGYRAINMLRVEVDTIQRVGAVIDATIAAGANNIADLSFELRNPEGARLDALRLAVERARQEAEVVAAAAGQRLVEPLSISTTFAYEPAGRFHVAEAAVMAPPPAPTPIEPGTMRVTATVNITYRIENR